MLARDVGRKLALNGTFVQKQLQTTEALIKSAAQHSDVLFGNLESVISTKGTPLSKAYVFEANPKTIDLLKRFGFTHLSVSNNHAEDYGEDAWKQSVQLLKDHEIVPVGQYHNEPVVETTQIGSRSVGFLAFQNLTLPLNTQTVLDAIRDAKKTHDLVVVSMHWGIEYDDSTSPQQIALAHLMIDAGANLVIGTHPHVLQPIEEYHGGVILYSLGNFIFDQAGEKQNTSEIVTVDFWKDRQPTLRITPVKIQNYFPTIK